ncbi:MAG: TolC family protein [Flammeovirgaceae bacterium]|nr:TolC family protein [Flammeovirgaceae bacterium]
MRLLIFFLFPLVGFAQQTNPVSISAERQRIETILSNESALDSLTENAIKNSYFLKSFEGELVQQYENVIQEKNKWLSTFRLGINFFSVTTTNINNESVTTAGVLPNIGFTLGLDPEKFINRRSYIREAKQNIVRAENQVKHQRRQVRDEILRLFYQYLETLGILDLRQEANQAQQEHCQVIEEKFKKGEARMEEILLNQSALVLTQESLMKAQIAARKLQQQIRLITEDTESAYNFQFSPR